MAKGLKVVMIIYGVILVLVGLLLIFLPDQAADMWGVSDITDFAKFTGLGLGAVYLAAGVWVVVAGRDPLQHINWVKFVITKGALSIVASVYAIIMDYIPASPFMWMLVVDAVLIALLLVFYPWRAARSGG
jgi:hypothetical protein